MPPYKTTNKGRYKGHKGKFWNIFSDFIRLRDFINHRTCITCGKRFTQWNESQAGHYMAAGNCGFGLLFDENNVHAECPYDNGFNSNHQITFAQNLDKRYKRGYAKALEERYKDSHFKGVTYKEWNKREYETKTEEYKQKVIDLYKQLKS